MGRHTGVLLAALIAFGTVLVQQQRHGLPLSRFELPAFDSYVYVAMAENPAVFSAAPWGYRVLLPFLAHEAPPRARLLAFRRIASAALVLAGALFFLFLRRLGHGELPSIFGVLAFLLAPPLAEVARNPVMNEPLALALEVGLLLAIESGAGLAVIALLMAVGSLSKEIFFLVPPLVLLTLREREGWRRACWLAALSALPAVVLVATLRLWWTPYLAVPHAPLNLELVRAGLSGLERSWKETGPALLVGGLLPLGLLGALRRRARPYLVRYGYLLLAFLGLALAGWTLVPSPRPVPLFGANTLRLLAYALPVLIPLALVAVDRVFPHLETPPVAGRPGRLAGVLALLGLAACLAFPFAALDRYRRVPLHEPRDGPLVLALCSESLRTARRLERGEEVALDTASLRFVWGVSDPGEVFRMRWFLREGWGASPHYTTEEVVMRGAQATVLLPVLVPREVEAELSLRSDVPRELDVRVNGREVGAVRTGPEAAAAKLRVPERYLFRGDNELTLVNPEGSVPQVRLERVSFRQAR